MKRVRMILTGVLLSALTLPAAAGNDRPIVVGELPAVAREFLRTHFDGLEVSYAKVDEHFFDKEYKVVFVNGAKVEFAKDGAWKEVDCKYGEVPAAAVPRQIADEVARLFPACRIVSIERDRSEYEVKLDNGTELTFDRKFRLTDMDD